MNIDESKTFAAFKALAPSCPVDLNDRESLIQLFVEGRHGYVARKDSFKVTDAMLIFIMDSLYEVSTRFDRPLLDTELYNLVIQCLVYCAEAIIPALDDGDIVTDDKIALGCLRAMLFAVVRLSSINNDIPNIFD